MRIWFCTIQKSRSFHKPFNAFKASAKSTPSATLIRLFTVFIVSVIKFPGSRKLFLSVIFARVAYAMVWFDMAAAFPAIQLSSHYSLTALGAFTTAFLLGSGIFQVPAGVFSARYGATRSTLIGLFLVTLFSFASSFSYGYAYQLLVRFVTGLGAAFFFAPAMVVASNLLGGKRSGLAIGLYNAAFNLGGGLALFVFTPLAAYLSWNAPFLMTGTLLLLALVFCVYTFRGIKEDSSKSESKVRQTLSSLQIWSITLGVFGVSVAYYVVSQYMVEYTERELYLSPELSGAISSMILLGGLFGAPLGGYLSDRISRKRVALVSSILTSFCVALLSLKTIALTWASCFLLGAFDAAAYTSAYAIPAETQNIGRRYAPLAIGLMNSVGILGGSLASPVFASFVVKHGYSLSWLLLGLVTTLFAPLLYLRLQSTDKVSTTPKTLVKMAVCLKPCET